MFSPRFLAVFAFVATVAALPASDDPSFPFPVTTITETDVDDSFPWYFPFNIKNFFTPILQWFPNFEEVGPRIQEDENKLSVFIKVKDYKKEDLKVKVKGDYILVQGSREAKHDDHDLFASQFIHTYSLPLNCSASDVTATLTSDNYLVINAPIKGSSEKDKEVDLDVPIVESGKPLPKDELTPNTDLTTISDNESDKKEPTTPPTAEESTERDNTIPHGSENEVQP